MSRSSSEHEWADARLVTFASGLLPPESHDRFEAHVESCSICKARLARLREAHQEEGHHVPRRVLLDWIDQIDRMKGLQRKLVLQHLNSCEECRAVLARLGIDPTKNPKPADAVRPLWARREFWMGTGVGGLAAAAALVLTVTPITRDHDWSERGSEPGSVAQPLPPGTITSVSEPVRLGTDRSAGSKVTVVRPTAGRRAASIFVQPTDLSPGQLVVLSILLGDSLVAETTLEPADFGEGRRLLWRSPSAIPPGRYSLILATPARAETLAFEVSGN